MFNLKVVCEPKKREYTAVCVREVYAGSRLVLFGLLPSKNYDLIVKKQFFSFKVCEKLNTSNFNNSDNESPNFTFLLDKSRIAIFLIRLSEKCYQGFFKKTFDRRYFTISAIKLQIYPNLSKTAVAQFLGKINK